MVAALSLADLAALDRAALEDLLPYVPEEERAFVMDALASLTPEIVVETPGLPFAEFVRQSWSIIEPGTLYLHNWHIDLIAELLTAVTRGEVPNALVNIPPRCMKSTIVSVMWPAWEWTLKPSLRYLTGGYGKDLATQHTLAMRRLVESGWYQERWGHKVQLAKDQNQKTRFQTTEGGGRLATSVESGGTGEGGDRIIVDDPIAAEAARSRVEREKAIAWFRGTLSTRVNNPRTLAKVIVMQRLHENDLTGYVLEEIRRGGEYWEHLVLPMEWEPGRMVCVPEKPWTRDPRTDPGALLWPERFDAPFVAAWKIRLGNDAPGQLQQSPAAPGGNIYRETWWKDGRNRFDPWQPSTPKVIERALFLDTALKDEEQNDYSACSLLELLADYRVRFRPLWNEHLQFHELIDRIDETATDFRGRLLRHIVIEDKVSGISAVQSLRARGAPWLRRLIEAFMPQGSKEYRYRHSANYCAADCVLLPETGDPRVPELHTLEYQLKHVPASEDDDLADTFSMAIIFYEHFIEAGLQRRLRRAMRQARRAA